MWKSNQFDEKKFLKGKNIDFSKNPFPFPPKNTFFRQITQILLGCDIFDELCLRIDVNQKYAELLPQWKDVAHQLEIDQLMTKWVEVCVRPKEGLARAMLEIYMKDGGKYLYTYVPI